MLNDADTIPPDKRNKIFDKFTKVNASLSRTSEGSGLGLYLTKGLVNLHGGEISINAGPIYGNLYKIVFPYDKNLKTKENYLNHDITTNELEQNKNRFIETENKLVTTKGERDGRRGEIG